MSAPRARLPAVYGDRIFVNDGGLASYGTDVVDVFRQAAAYVDRILRGDRPADLPVQAPVKYETVLNLETARALGHVHHVQVPKMFKSDIVLIPRSGGRSEDKL